MENSDVHEPFSDAGSNEDEEHATKETTVLSSSSSFSEARSNQDSIKETEQGEEAEATYDALSSLFSEARINQGSIEETKEEEEAEANDNSDAEEKKKRESESWIFSDILADIEENPKILEPEVEKNIRNIWFEDDTPLGFNSAALRLLDFHSEVIDINAYELESLKGRKQEAIKLGVDLSYLVAEAMFFFTDQVLNTTAKTMQSYMRLVNGPKNMNNIVVYNLTEVFNSLKMRVKFPLFRPKIEFTEPSQINNFFRLFSDAITLLEDVVRGICNLSRTRFLEEEPEKVSALDSTIQDCKRQLRKIDLAISEAKQLCIKGLSNDEKTSLVLWTKNLEESFFGIWNSLFQPIERDSDESVETDSDGSVETDSDESVSQSSIQ